MAATVGSILADDCKDLVYTVFEQVSGFYIDAGFRTENRKGRASEFQAEKDEALHVGPSLASKADSLRSERIESRRRSDRMH